MGFALPGMVTPTLDVDELERRIKDLKAVEGWLKMNLNMLQMTIQGLEVQCATLAAVRAMSERARQAASPEAASTSGETSDNEIPNPFNPAALWPWLVQGMQQAAASGAAGAPEPAATPEPDPQAPDDGATSASRTRRARKAG